GATFSDALKRHPKIFDDLFVNLVHAGEVGGILDTILNRLAIYIEKSVKLRRQIRGALTYPIVVICIMIIVMVVLMTFVIPAFENMYSELAGSSQLPALTRMVIAVSNVFLGYLPFIVIGVVGIVVGFIQIYKRRAGKRAVHKFILYMPIIGAIIQKITVARFSRTMSTLLQSGVPILDAITIVARSAGNVVVEEGLLYARDRI